MSDFFDDYEDIVYFFFDGEDDLDMSEVWEAIKNQQDNELFLF